MRILTAFLIIFVSGCAISPPVGHKITGSDIIEKIGKTAPTAKITGIKPKKEYTTLPVNWVWGVMTNQDHKWYCHERVSTGISAIKKIYPDAAVGGVLLYRVEKKIFGPLLWVRERHMIMWFVDEDENLQLYETASNYYHKLFAAESNETVSAKKYKPLNHFWMAK